jgi:transcriptional regulator with XRE-family HTH domain
MGCFASSAACFCSSVRYLLRTYISHVENGHSTPTLQVLEKWAAALDVELYQLFVVGQGEPEAAVLSERIQFGAQERALLGIFGQMPVVDRGNRGRSPHFLVLPSPCGLHARAREPSVHSPASSMTRGLNRFPLLYAGGEIPQSLTKGVRVTSRGPRHSRFS